MLGPEYEYRPKKAFSRAGFALMFATVAGLGLVYLAGWMARSGIGGFQRILYNDTLQLLASYIPLYGIGFLIFWLLIRKLPPAPIVKERMGFGRLFMLFCIGYGFSYLLNLLGSLITVLTGGMNISGQIQSFILMDSPLAVIIPVVVAPVAEELIFRKILIDRLIIYGEKTAIIFSAVCFGLFHRNLTQFLYAFWLGMVFGYVYSRSGKIHYTMGMHFLINGFSTLVARAASGMLRTASGSGGLSFDDIMGGRSTSSLAVVGLFGLAAIALVIMGIVFFCIRIRTLQFYYDEPLEIPKGQVFKTVYLNPGVILFAAVCIAFIVMNLMGIIL